MSKASTFEKLQRTLGSEQDRLAERFSRASTVLLGTAAATAPEPAPAPAPPADAAPRTSWPLWQPGTAVFPGQRLRVRPDSLVDSSYNARYFYAEEAVMALATSLARDGQLEPVRAYAETEAPEQLVVHDGATRCRALRYLRAAFVDVEVIAPPLTALENYCLSRSRNRNRSPGTVLDDAKRFTQLLADGQVPSAAELAQRVGEHKVYVSKALTIGALEEELLEAMARHPEVFGLAAAYYVARYRKSHDVAATAQLVRRIAQGGLSTRQLERLAADETALPPRKERTQAMSAVKLPQLGGELRAYPDGRLALRLQASSGEQRDRLFAALLQTFTEHGIQLDHAPTGTATAK